MIPAPFAPTGPLAVRILEQLVAEAWLAFLDARTPAERRDARQFWLAARPALAAARVREMIR